MSLLDRIKLKNKLKLAQKRDGGAVAGSFKSVVEFLSDAAEAAKDNSVLISIAKALPWSSLEIVGGAAVETLPPLKFVAGLLSKAFEIDDPDELAYLACTIAYQRSVDQAVRKLGWNIASRPFPTEPLKRSLLDSFEADAMDFETFNFPTALGHPFVTNADDALKAFANHYCLSGDEERHLLGAIHDRFVVNLKELLAVDVKRFEPFTRRLDLGVEEARSTRIFDLHVADQIYQFTEQPVFGQEPFSLQEIYIGLECGGLIWGEIKKSRSKEHGQDKLPLDPFLERNGGRQDLMMAVLQLLRGRSWQNVNKPFRDAIVIQGVAGSGKSTFTLALCEQLRLEGLRPIRIRLRDLRLDIPIGDALAQAVYFRDPAENNGHLISLTPEQLKPEHLAADHFLYHEADICRTVLILDGWDELSIGSSGNLHDRIDRVLNDVRNTYLERHGAPIRVIVTGRPSSSVEESRFLHETTPIFTIRSLNPTDLSRLVEKLDHAFARPSKVFPHGQERLGLKLFQSVLTSYSEQFKANQSKAAIASELGTLDVLGHPLLAQVVLRLIAWRMAKPEELVDDPTRLYRTLIDVTCSSGQVEENRVDPDVEPRLTGWKLRRFLRQTASAVTILGSETISRTELALRLPELERRRDLMGDHNNPLQGLIDDSEKNRLAEMLVAWHFKIGHAEAGCEFAHKSFREYLFAEAIVEALKENLDHNPGPRLPRAALWKDFADESDPRFHLSRTLAPLLAPHSLSPEVKSHVRRLIAWEIRRDAKEPEESVGGLRCRPTKSIGQEGWKVIRDDLAELWEWWGEGVHLRPKIQYKRGKREGETDVYALSLIESSMPYDPGLFSSSLPAPSRTVTIDGHLGAGLLLLNVAIHAELILAHQHDSQGSSESVEQPLTEQHSMQRFCLSRHRDYFSNYLARMKAAGWIDFTVCDDLRWTKLNDSELAGTNLCEADLSGADLRRAGLSGANLRGADLRGADLSGANLRGADLREVDLIRADLSGAYLSGAYLSGAHLSGADLSRTDLREADLIRTDFRGADLSGADLSRTDLRGADLRAAQLSWADLIRADLRGAYLSRADLSGADLNGADLSGADLRGAHLNGIKLDEILGSKIHINKNQYKLYNICNKSKKFMVHES